MPTYLETLDIDPIADPGWSLLPMNLRGLRSLKTVLEYEATDLATNIANNITINYFPHLYRFVNQAFKADHDRQINLLQVL